MKAEIYLETPLTGCIEQAPENLSVRLQCSGISRGGLGFVFDLLHDGDTVLSAGMRAAEITFIALYLAQVTGRISIQQYPEAMLGAWQTILSMRLYSDEGGTNCSGEIWVEDGAIWVGYGCARQLVARARLDQAQLVGLTRLADAMEAEFA
jgi:hypothetical protein